MNFDKLNDPSLDHSSPICITLSENFSSDENSFSFDYQQHSILNSDFPFSSSLNAFKENELQFSSSLLKSKDNIYEKNNSNDSVDNRINNKGKKNMFQSSSSFSFNKFSQNIDNNKIFRTKIKKEKKEIYLNKKRNIIKKKPGRKTIKMNTKKMHSSSAYDNLQLKIQVHFQNFIINLSNDVLSTFGLESEFGYFKKISYSEKKNITFSNFFKLQKEPIKNIIQKEITKNYKKFEKDNNKNILEKVSQKEEWIKDFFNMEYIELFKFYFYHKKGMKTIRINNKDINLSEKTRAFYHLINKNEELESLLQDAVKRRYYKSFKFTIINI